MTGDLDGVALDLGVGVFAHFNGDIEIFDRAGRGGAADGDRRLANGLAETPDLATDFVATGGERGRARLSFGAGLEFAAEVRFDVGDADGCAEDDPA